MEIFKNIVSGILDELRTFYGFGIQNFIVPAAVCVLYAAALFFARIRYRNKPRTVNLVTCGITLVGNILLLCSLYLTMVFTGHREKIITALTVSEVLYFAVFGFYGIVNAWITCIIWIVTTIRYRRLVRKAKATVIDKTAEETVIENVEETDKLTADFTRTWLSTKLATTKNKNRLSILVIYKEDYINGLAEVLSKITPNGKKLAQGAYKKYYQLWKIKEAK